MRPNRSVCRRLANRPRRCLRTWGRGRRFACEPDSCCPLWVASGLLRPRLWRSAVVHMLPFSPHTVSLACWLFEAPAWVAEWGAVGVLPARLRAQGVALVRDARPSLGFSRLPCGTAPSVVLCLRAEGGGGDLSALDGRRAYMLRMRATCFTCAFVALARAPLSSCRVAVGGECVSWRWAYQWRTCGLHIQICASP